MMKRTTREVLLLDSPALAPLAALAPPFEARVLDWAALAQAARRAPPSAVVVIDPFTAGDPFVLDPRVRELIERVRMVPVVARVPFAPGYAGAARTLLDWGASEIVDAELEGTPDAIHARLLSVHAQPLKRVVEGSLSRFVSMDALTLVRAAAEVAVDGGTALDLARIFDARERTVAGWCAREGLPPPRRLLAWLRLVLALALLEDPRRSVVSAALSAGYTDYSFRRALRELVGAGATPRERSPRQALAAFNAELRARRERARPAPAA
ncbi:MAG TPA: hypothetical protein VHG91_03810 [Longimicrobium sp.]|nr:hypothetical protein [Longimicrobium sp.]